MWTHSRQSQVPRAWAAPLGTHQYPWCFCLKHRALFPCTASCWTVHTPSAPSIYLAEEEGCAETSWFSLESSWNREKREKITGSCWGWAKDVEEWGRKLSLSKTTTHHHPSQLLSSRYEPWDGPDPQKASVQKGRRSLLVTKGLFFNSSF